MLLNLREYHRPGDAEGVAQALKLLSRPGIRTVLLAGGDALVGAADPTVEAVVDLKGWQTLDFISDTDLNAGAAGWRHDDAGGSWRRYQVIIAQTPSPDHHCGGRRRWGGSVQRNRATLGGALAMAASNDPLIVALLACDTYIAVATLAGYRGLPLAEFLADRARILAEPALITNINVPLPEVDPTGYALAEVGRTPADAPIVVAAAAVGRKDGQCVYARLALGGVAETPIRLPEVEMLLAQHLLTAELITRAAALAASLVQPTGDFRGSAEYRRAMAGVLTERALSQAWRGRRVTSNE